MLSDKKRVRVRLSMPNWELPNSPIDPSLSSETTIKPLGNMEQELTMGDPRN